MLPKEAGGGRQHPRMFLKASLKCWSQKGKGKGRIKLWSRLPVQPPNAHMNTCNNRDDVEQSPIKKPLYISPTWHPCLVLCCQRAPRDASGLEDGS